MSDYLDLQEQIDAGEADFIEAVEWLRAKLNVTAFSKKTLSLLRQLSLYVNLEGSDGGLAGIEEEAVVFLVKEQISTEKKEEAQKQNNMRAALLDAADGEEDRQHLGQIWSQMTSQQESHDEHAEPGQPKDDAGSAEAIPVALELFSAQEREGIKAVAAYLGVLYGALPDVSAFRAQYLPQELLSPVAAQHFLKSSAIRFLSLSDFEKLGVSVLDHNSKLLTTLYGKPTLEELLRLSGEISYHPPSSSPHSDFNDYDSQRVAEEGLRRWYRYTVTLEVTSAQKSRALLGKQKTTTQVVEKTLIAADRKPVTFLSDPFFKTASKKTASEELVTGREFTQIFPDSVAGQLLQLVTSRGAVTSIPGGRLEKAMFVLTGTLDYNPVTAVITKRPISDLNASEAGAAIAARLRYGQGLSERVAIESDAWVTSETIRKIYQKQQGLLTQAAEGSTRFKISKADSLHLVSEVINIYLREKVTPSYQRAFTLLRQAGKVTGTADNFRKRYKRACEILNVPFHLEDVVRHIRNRS